MDTEFHFDTDSAGGDKSDQSVDLLDPNKMAMTEKTNKADTIERSDSETSGDDYERGVWGRKVEFILSVVGYSVGVGNLWRFPYLVMQNGGGAFLIPYLFFMVLVGIPLFYLELCLGQFSGTSCLFVWKFCPLFKGVGYMMVMASFFYCWYYIMVLVWVLVYIVSSFRAILPWSECGNSWNTEYCIGGLNSIRTTCNTTETCNVTHARNLTAKTASTASKEFWHNYVLNKSNGLEDFGTIQWHLALALAVAWFIVFLCQMKGIKTVGKVVYVTAVLPYILLTVFLIKGLTLPGAGDGIKYYIFPDFTKLKDGQVWLQAALQVFFSLGPAWGALITMSSYNKFNNNCIRDALICCIVDGFTSFYGGFVIFSVVGYVAHDAKLDIEDVATSGPGLALVIYPEAISKLPVPQLWAVLFFLMLIALGIDSQFGMFETLLCGVTDMFPRLRKRKVIVCACLCTAIMIMDLPFTTNGGIYLSQLVDWYFAAFVSFVTAIMECILIAWIYGADRFSKDIQLMTGSGPPFIIRICWCFITPTIMIVTFAMMCSQYEPPDYDGYKYPLMAKVFGNILAILPVLPLPVAMVHEICKTEGPILERIKFLLKPSPDWGPRESKYREGYGDTYVTHTKGFVETVKQTLL